MLRRHSQDFLIFYIIYFDHHTIDFHGKLISQSFYLMERGDDFIDSLA
ncbi:hypothetical protein CP8484711_1451A, partial [Chlamydia psittaci 84-8471/1]